MSARYLLARRTAEDAYMTRRGVYPTYEAATQTAAYEATQRQDLGLPAVELHILLDLDSVIGDNFTDPPERVLR